MHSLKLQRIKILAAIALLPLVTFAAEIPDTVFPKGVGVNIHFTRGHEKDLDLIAAAGFKVVRMDFLWDRTERRRGEYDWSEYDELTSNLEKRGIRPYYILDYSNSLYEATVITQNPDTLRAEDRSTAAPRRPESIAAFARWAAAAANHFRGRHVIWEIWNEPNIEFWKPEPDVKQYIALAIATCKAIREADPQATIVAPATSKFPWGFLKKFLKSGVLDYLDGVSVHPYRSEESPPETAAEDYKRLRQLIGQSAPNEAKKKIPIISGEWGYSSDKMTGVSPGKQADFIVRQQLVNLLQGVPISIWYDWKNDGVDVNERNHNFGTVNYDLQPKPGYVAIQTLIRELSGYRITSRRNTRNKKDFVLILENTTGETKLAVWTVGKSHTVAFNLESAAATELVIVDGQGKRGRIEIGKNSFTVTLSSSPAYITLKDVQLK